MSDADLTGRKLGRYAIVARLGHGGMGVVYRAHDETLRRDVALKVLPEDVTRDGERRWRFLREARAAAAVTHPGIAAIYDAGEDDGRVYLAMELVEGDTLRGVMRAGPLAVDEVVHIVSEVARALDRAHDKGLVHRDLKPENVMLSHDGQVKVLDFGLAKSVRGSEAYDPATHATREGGVMGTPGYMSPEQSTGEPVDARTDIFALGVIAFELLAGRAPFVGSSAMSILISTARDAPPALHGLRPEVPEPLERVIERCLEKDPAARYPTVAALYEALTGQSLSPSRLPRGVRSSRQQTQLAVAETEIAPSSTHDVDPRVSSDGRPSDPASDPRASSSNARTSARGGERGPAREAISTLLQDDRAPAAVRPRADVRGVEAATSATTDLADLGDLAEADGHRGTKGDEDFGTKDTDLAASREVRRALANDGDATSRDRRSQGNETARGDAPDSSARRTARRRGWLGAVGVVGLVGVLGLATAIFTAVRPASIGTQDGASDVRSALGPAGSSRAGGAAAAVSAVDTVAAVALTDLPVTSSSPEALSAYRAAIRASRLAGQTDAARAQLDHVLALDPTMTAVRVRIVSGAMLGSVDEGIRAHYRSALADREGLMPRDRDLLDALEPAVMRQPSDWAEMARRLEPLTVRYPGDAEIWLLYGTRDAVRHGMQASLPALDHAAELDPLYITPLWVGAQFRAYLGRFDEAHSILRECLSRGGAAASGCRRQEQQLLESEGQCESAEDNARQMIAAEPDRPASFQSLAQSLASRGRPLATVQEALRQRLAVVSPTDRAREQAQDTIRMALLSGDFVTAERESRALERLERDSRSEAAHSTPARWLVDALSESGRTREAGVEARSFLERRDAWEPDPRVDDFAMAADPTPELSIALRRANLISTAASSTQRDEWRNAWERKLGALHRPFVWLYGWAAPVYDADDARAALAVLPQYEPTASYRVRTLVEASVGRTYLLAGRLPEAIPWLREACRKCYALSLPVAHVRAWATLAEALEQSGDKAGACTAYGRVLERWGSAKPRSITADLARERRTSLGCP